MKRIMVLAGVLAWSMAAQAAALGNADVIKLLSAGLGEATVLQAIETAAQTEFDTSVDSLIALKKAGATDAVIQKMMTRQAGKSAGPATTAAASAPTGGACDYEVKGMETQLVMRIDGKLVPVSYQTVSINTDVSGGSVLASALTFGIISAKGNNSIRLKGEHAKLKIQNRTPEFLDLMAPAGADPEDVFPIVRLTPKAKEKSRVMEIASSEIGIVGAKSRDSSDLAQVPFTFEKLQDLCIAGNETYSRYRMKPTEPLTIGEYALFIGNRAYDFAVTD